MGYVRAKRYKLVFADDEFAGLEVTAKPLPVGEHLELLELLDARPDAKQIRPWVEQVNTRFAAALLSWNLETDDGDPVPATADGLNGQDYEFCFALVRAYIDAVTGVAAPLEQQSNGGVPFPEESLPMEPLSPSLAS